MIPYNELNKVTRRLVLGKAANLTISYFNDTLSAKPRDVAYVAMTWKFATDSPFQWDPEHQQEKYRVCDGASWEPPYAVTSAINNMSEYYACCGAPNPQSRKHRKQFDTVEVPMPDIVEYIQGLCRRATGEVRKND